MIIVVVPPAPPDNAAIREGCGYGRHDDGNHCGGRDNGGGGDNDAGSGGDDAE